MESLIKLSLPPSLFALSAWPTSGKLRIISEFNIKYLSLYVFEFEAVEFRYFMREILPKTLKELHFHDDTRRIARELKNAAYEQIHFKVGALTMPY